MGSAGMTQSGANLTVPLAHSAAEKSGAPQSYAEHVIAVRSGSRTRAEAMLRFAAPISKDLLNGIDAASAYHDLGKLDEANQAALSRGRKTRLPWDHIDAGVAHLTACGSGMAAWLVRAHHAPGLPSMPIHFDKDHLGRRLRGRRNDDADPALHDSQIARTALTLPYLVATHASAVAAGNPLRSKVSHGLEMRLALSCLVDADHTDTARFDTGEPPPEPVKPRWADRLASLDAYVAALPQTGNLERDNHRKAFYVACRESAITAPLVACEGPVGIGKTTAVTAYLLQRAQVVKLRRLVIVAPYTNIISQTADILRKALTLPGEVPEEVVAEHHHRADFGSRAARDLAITWSAPVIVTTAVEFFETLAANAPASLRKLHTLPGSAIFIDEAHAAIPAHLWPQNWRWLDALARRWTCCVVFASGSLARFWENGEVIARPQRLPELLGEDLRRTVLSAERQRIRYESAGRFETVAALIASVAKWPGPRLVILNTVQSAAVVARAMRNDGRDVLHLSTALAPKDRSPLLRIVKERLLTKPTDWTLVATSCVEAGVDLSFRTAFRERFSTTSLIQTGGRVNRHGEADEGTVIDFLIDAANGITSHPAARHPAEVLGHLFKRGVFETDDYDPAEIVTKSMADEIKERGIFGTDRLGDAEAARDYPAVAELGRVIDADTRIVVIDPMLARRIDHFERVKFRDMLAGSVQLWAYKIDLLALERLRGNEDAFRWSYEYDPTFLGIMEGILRRSDFIQKGFMIL